MSRHRIVRTMDYNDEYDGYDDVYGHSVDDDTCISPTDAQQWIYDRARGQQSMSAFIRNNKDISEEEEENASDECLSDVEQLHRRDSESFQLPILDDELEQAKLNSCIDEVRNVVGDSISERRIVECVMRYQYDVAKVLDSILNDKDDKLFSKDNNNIKVRQLPILIKSNANAIATNSANILNTTTNATKVVKLSNIETNTRRGFDVQVSATPSPAASGRNTPETDEKTLVNNVVALKVSKEQIQRNGNTLYTQERARQKSSFHLVVIGHVDAGKSTLMGHLLYATGNVSQRLMHRYEQESRKLGKQSFMFAWVMDETNEERARGITMDVGQTHIETKNKIITLLDAPGHKDFIPSMISGATQADVALLVVDATRGEFETGFELGGQTREHALLVRSLGVQQLGVAVNKLDTVDWSQQRFDEIVNKLRIFLKSAGFKDSDVTFIPCSGLTGENLAKPAREEKLKAWYKGPTLLDVIDGFKTPERAVDRPLRMCVADVFKAVGTGCCIAGRIETGMLAVNDRLLIGASREAAQIKSLTVGDSQYQQSNAFAGDQVCLTLAGGLDVSKIQIGSIVCDPLQPVPITSRFQARLLVFNVKVPITKGFPVLLHYQSLIEPAVICKLVAQLHKATGDVIKKHPRCLGNNSCALIELETTRPICIERYADFKELGRFMLRVSGVTIAAGMVTKIR